MIPGGYVVRANGQSLVHIYSRDSEAEALQARGSQHRRQRGTPAAATRQGGLTPADASHLGNERFRDLHQSAAPRHQSSYDLTFGIAFCGESL